jgi:hypothetical protein
MTGIFDLLLGLLGSGLGTGTLPTGGSFANLLAAPVLGAAIIGPLLLLGGFLQFGLGINVFGLVREFVIGGGTGIPGF